MVPRISAFTSLPTPVKIGILVISGGGIMAAMRYILPRRVFWVVFIGIAIVALLLLLYWRLLKWLKKRKATPMERGLMDNTAATPQGISKPAHVARLDDLRKQFEGGVAKFQAAGKSLYGFPWYVIVGEPGSGKTEAIRHCNVGFPPGLQDEFQGAGGTLNMNWWFTDHAVILDTAGRLMFEEVETGGSSEWKEFLNLLKRNRTRCPINGVLLVIPVDSLVKDTADDIERKASKIAQQFDVIQRALDVRFPVFVVVTKSDLIGGFRDFFDNLDDPQLQHQILGWSNPAPLDEPYNPEFIDQHLKAIRGRLFRRRLALMQEVISEEPGAERMRTADTLYAFPQSLTKITPRMARYLELIFSVGSQWSCKPLFFRGIYFTSSMREGSALDEDLAESLGVPVDSLPDGRVWERDRAYFLRDLFMKKVFREQGLVTYATNAKKLHSRRKATVLISAAASVILLLFFTFYATTRFSKSIGNMEYFLGAALNDSGELNELQVIKRQGDDDWRYFGREHIAGMPDDVKRFNFSAQLADVVNRWEKKGVPWIFAPAAKFAKGIESDKLRKAQAVVYEAGVLQPFLSAASDMMDTQQNGRWTRDDTEAKALCQLVRIKANKVLGEGDRYSAQTFLAPLYAYVFGYDEDSEERGGFDKMYDEHNAKLHQPLGIIYGAPEDKKKLQWPPPSLKTDPNSPDPAIERGVNLFNTYWTDPNRGDADTREYARVETIQALKDALQKFDDAEKTILRLNDELGPKSDKSFVLEQCEKTVGDWSESFTSLNEARETIHSCAGTLRNPPTLAELWVEAANNALQEVTENYEFLLNELENVEQLTFLGRMRTELEKHLKSHKGRLDISKVEEKLKQFDKEFWIQLENSRLYEVRFQMYSRANKQLGAAKRISGLNEVSGAIREVKRAVKKARQEVDELLSLDRAAFRLQEASGSAALALGLAEQRQLYYIVKSGLEVAPKNVGELETLIKKESKEDFEYDPSVAVAVLDGWNLLGETLKSHFPKETRFREIYEAANGIYTGYAGKYLDYWLETKPGRFITSKIPRESNWKAQHNQLEKLDVLDVFGQLEKLGKSTEEEALNKFENYIPGGDEKVKQFRNNMEKLGDKFFQRKCERILEKWAKLSDDVFRARNTLLNSKPIPLVKDYFPSLASSSAEFVDAYWTRLTIESLRLIAEQAQHEGEEALTELKMQYSSKFPLERDSIRDLTPAELKKARSLLGRVQSWEQYGPETIGGGAETGVAEVDKLLDRLREVRMSNLDKEWIKGIRQVFQGLPDGKDPYYCKITLLSGKEQERLVPKDEKLLLDHFKEFRLVQGNHAGARLRTRSSDEKGTDAATVKYPGPAIRIDFYRYPADKDNEPRASLEFSQPWACLKMFCPHAEPDKGQGYIKLRVKDNEGLERVLYLQLEFCKDNKCQYKVDLPRPDRWPSLKRQ